MKGLVDAGGEKQITRLGQPVVQDITYETDEVEDGYQSKLRHRRQVVWTADLMLVSPFSRTLFLFLSLRIPSLFEVKLFARLVGQQGLCW